MINRTHVQPIVRQCQLLALSRSTAYDQPTPVSAADLALMHRIDELHLDHPFAGARMLAICSGEKAIRLGGGTCPP